MNLLLVTGRFPERSETFIYRKAVGLARRGHEVTVATRQIGDWSIYPDPVPPTLQVETLPPTHTWRDPRRLFAAVTEALRSTTRSVSIAKRLHELCRRRAATAVDAYRLFLQHAPLIDRGADIAHFEFLSLAAMYPLAREALGCPVIVSCRGSDVHTLELRPPREREVALEVLRSADAVHCVSQDLASTVTRISGRTTGLCVNRPAVEVDRISPRVSSPAGGPLRVVATGRLVWKKGFDYLLTALAQLRSRGIELHADILGDGELRNVLRYSIEDLGLQDSVRLGGAVTSSQVLEYLQKADVFVLSSVSEGISNAALEAMATGLPVITTTAGGMAEAVTDGVEGFVVPTRDAAALADRLERLARDPELRATMGRAARERAAGEFSITRQIGTFEALYESMLGRGAA